MSIIILNSRFNRGDKITKAFLRIYTVPTATIYQKRIIQMKKSTRISLNIAGALVLLIVGAVLIGHGGINIRQIMQLRGGSIIFSLILLLAVYFAKGIIMVIPIQALYLAGGALTGNFFSALAVNAAGVCLCLSSGYALGRAANPSALGKLAGKYEKLRELDRFQGENALFFSYMIRMVGILPCDIVSLYCGAKKIPYPQYLAGSLAGMLPGIILTGMMGANIHNPRSPQFILALVLQILVSLFSVLIYKKMKSANFRRKE